MLYKYHLVIMFPELFTKRIWLKAIKNVHQVTSTCLSSKIRSLSSSSEYSELNSEDNCEAKKKLKHWFDICKYNGVKLPENINDKDIHHLIFLSHFQRLKYITSLLNKERRITKNSQRKVEKNEEKKKQKEERDHLQPHHIKYGLWQNSLFGKITNTCIRDFYYHRLASAAIHNQPIILDMSFDTYMNLEEKKLLALQIKFSIEHNKKNSSPFNLILCNVDYKSETMIHLKKIQPNIDKIPLIITSQSYIDLYPKKKLVYLSPNAHQEMKTFNRDAIYIIGGVADSAGHLLLSYSKAKKEEIKSQKLPLDQ